MVFPINKPIWLNTLLCNFFQEQGWELDPDRPVGQGAGVRRGRGGGDGPDDDAVVEGGAEHEPRVGQPKVTPKRNTIRMNDGT